MHRFWSTITEPLLRAARPRVVVEVGADAGQTTVPLAAWCAARRAKLHIVDPAVRFDAAALARQYARTATWHARLSLEALPAITHADVVLLDGDHNWYTVYHELRILAANAARDAHPFPLVLMHDTGWPYGHRDLYYLPDSIPAEYRHPYSPQGMLPGQSDLTADGFNLHLNNAVTEGGPRNGVRAALDDFLRESAEQGTFVGSVIHLPVLHGYSILAPTARLTASRTLARAVRERTPSAPLAALMELTESERLRATIAMQQARRNTGQS